MDNVHKPAHYSGDGIECIDVIEATLGPYGFRMFCLGNVLKYSWRHRQKNGAEDLAKADVYRAWMLAGTSQGRNPAGDKSEISLASDFARATLDESEVNPAAFADADDSTDHLKAGEVGREAAP